jgi:hypothetical protein
VKRFLLASAAVGTILLAAPAWAAEAAPELPRLDPRTISLEGFGTARAGMSVADAGKALGVKLQETAAAKPDEPAACHTADGVELPGVTFVIENGKVVRIDVYGAGYQTAKGVRIGMKEGEVKARYPGIQVTPHKYDSAGHYLTVASKDRKFGIVFETDGALVTSMRSGGLPFVARPDACP